MNWIQLDSQLKLKELNSLSFERRVMIFCFSKQTTVNLIVKFTLEREWNPREMEMPVYLLDAFENKSLSDSIFNELSLKAVTPQALILEKGKCIFSAADGEINFKTLRDWSNPKK